MSRGAKLVSMVAVGVLATAVIGYTAGRTVGVKAKSAAKPAPLVGPGSKPVVMTGKVTLPDGTPAAKALVKITWPDLLKTYTDSAGRYKLTVTRNWSHVYARLGDYVRSLAINPDSSTVDITLKQGDVVRGKVVDERTLKPIAGAEVLTYYHVRAKTLADGSFALGPIDEYKQTISVVKPGYSRPITIGSAGETDLTIYVKSEGVVKGRITDDRGKPIAGALVKQSIQSFEWQYTKTNADGRYALYGFDPAAPPLKMEVSASAHGYKTAQISFPSGKRVIVKNFVLARGVYAPHDLSGRVLMPGGKPAVGAPVSCESFYSSLESDIRSGTTDAQGRYAFKDVPAGERYIVAHAAGMAPAFGFFEGKSDARVDMKFSKGHWLKGRVLSGSGVPLAGAVIRASIANPKVGDTELEWSYEDPHLQTNTSQDGSFTLTDLPAGAVFLTVSGVKGYSEARGLHLVVDTKGNTIRLQQLGELTISVTDARTGKPVTNASVQIANSWNSQPEDKRTDTPSAPVWVDPITGKFVVKSLVAGSAVRLTIDAKGYRQTVVRRVEVKPAGQVTFAFIKLEPGFTASGVVVDEKGTLLEGVEVKAKNGWGYDIQFRDRSGQKTTTASAVTGTDGRFVIPDLPLQIGSVSAEKAGYKTALLENVYLDKPLSMKLTAGSNSKPDDEISTTATQGQTKSEDGGITVSGIVIDEKTGRPAAERRVGMMRARSYASKFPELDKWYGHSDRDWWWIEKSTTTDAKGGFVFHGLDEGQWVVSVSPPSRRRVFRFDYDIADLGGHIMSPKLELKKGAVATENESRAKHIKSPFILMTLPELGSCRVRTVDASTGQSIQPWGMAWFSESGPQAHIEQSRNVGQPDLPALYGEIAPGRYTVYADAPGYYTASSVVEIKSGTKSDLTLKLQPAQSIVFRLDEAEDSQEPNGRWRIGYRIGDPMSRMTFERAYGHYSGGMANPGGDPPREGSVVAAPGVYELDLMLARDPSRNLRPEDIVWTGHRQVTVEQGKDTVVVIPFRELGLGPK